MKMVLSCRRHHYLAGLTIFLVVVALAAGMVGCGGGGGDESYALTVSTTTGGVVAVNDVIIPGTALFAYDAGTVVSLNATPDTGYRFINWTGNVSTVADVNATSTTITMNGDYSITANFALEIWDWYDLDAIRDDLSGYYLLMNNLDSTTAGYEELASGTANGGMGWDPIGSSDDLFTGTFDGQGYEIRDVVINRPAGGRAGLFGAVREGVVKNLGVVNATVTGYGEVGGLVGWNEYGTVSNCYFAGSVIGNGNVGGLVGWNYYGTGNNSYSTGSVTGSSWVGGLVGYNSGPVSNSYSTSSVTGEDLVGGLVGLNDDGAVTNCFWDTETSGQPTSAGGTGKTTAQMKSIATFSSAAWSIVTVANPSTRNPSYIWNIVDDETYPFLSWQPLP